MRKLLALLLLALTAVSGGAADFQEAKLVSAFAFGSCNRQEKPQEFWNVIAATQPEPDLYLALGDNVYADANTLELLQATYDTLGANPHYQAFRQKFPILATWDDHDYGVNDGGAEYPLKAESQRILLDFFGDPADSPRRTREGVYGSWLYGPPGRQIEFILLDTRYFRSPLKPAPPESRGTMGRWAPNEDPAATVLGAVQWAWLERRVAESPAQLLMVGSSIQVIPMEHKYEKWANFPLERARFLNLLSKRPAVILSGDRHLGEISLYNAGAVAERSHPLYEVTASGLTHSFVNGGTEVNRFRVAGDNVTIQNYGLIRVDWEAEDAGTPVHLEIYDLATGQRIRQRSTSLKELAGPPLQ